MKKLFSLGLVGIAAAALLGVGPAGAKARRAVEVDVSLGQPVLLAGKRTPSYLKIGLRGLELPRAATRVPVNLAIVLDRSSSMSGQKIVKAKEAALLAIDRLGNDDVVSLVTYDSTVEVLVPATKLGSDRQAIRSRVEAIQPRGNTALFAGLSKGIDEVRKFQDARRFARVVLLSDGQANIGPSSPNELGRLGASAAKEGISITTIGLGLGYNEDLMTQIALASDGNHAFAETGVDLARIFDAELGDVLSVVARSIELHLRFADGIRPVRALNREAEIRGNVVHLVLNQLYGGQEKYFLLEVEAAPGAAGSRQIVAEVEVAYANFASGVRERITLQPELRFSASPAEVKQYEQRDVMVAAVEALAAEKNRLAVELRDKGQVDDAKQLLLDNAKELEEQAITYGSKRLGDYGKKNSEDAEGLSDNEWNKRRKIMRKGQHTIDRQQSY